MYTLGIDIGSTTSKCAVLKDGTELVGKSLQRGGLGTDGPAGRRDGACVHVRRRGEKQRRAAGHQRGAGRSGEL